MWLHWNHWFIIIAHKNTLSLKTKLRKLINGNKVSITREPSMNYEFQDGFTLTGNPACYTENEQFKEFH